jgi:hypothetical protein
VFTARYGLIFMYNKLVFIFKWLKNTHGHRHSRYYYLQLSSAALFRNYLSSLYDRKTEKRTARVECEAAGKGQKSVKLQHEE